MVFRIPSFARYGAIGLLVVLVAGVVVVPFSKGVVEQWSRSDVESRSRLVFNAVQNSLDRAIQDQDWKRLDRIFENVALDERILAVGLCDGSGSLISPTKLMPKSFSCEKVARTEQESFSSVFSGGRRILIAAFPLAENDHNNHLVLLTDLSFIDARSGEAVAYLLHCLSAYRSCLPGRRQRLHCSRYAAGCGR